MKNGQKLTHVFEFSEHGKANDKFIGDIQFDDKEFLELGEKYEIIVRFLSQNPINKFMNIGRKWFIYDGDLEIGEGQIIEVKMPKND